MKPIIKVFILFSFIVIISTARAQDVEPVLTFGEFQRQVLLYYPRLKAAQADVEQALARKLQASAGFWPSVQGVTSVTVSDDPTFAFSSKLRQEAFTSGDFDLNRLNSPRHRTNYNATLQTEWPLFDAFQTISRLRAARKQADAAGEDKVFAEMEARLVAAEAYLRALAVDQDLAVTEQILKDSADDLQQAQDLKEQGMILGADFYAARVVAGDFTRQHNALLRQKQEATALLNILMGADPEKAWTVQGTLDGNAWPQRDLALWLETARSRRPDLKALEARYQAQEQDLRREQTTVLPKVSAFGAVSEDTDTLGERGGRNFSAGVKGTMDLFDPSHRGRVRASRAGLQKLEHQRLVLRDTITQDLSAEYYRMEAVKDNLPVVQAMTDDAREAVDLTLPLYREGRKSIADLLEIRRAYLNARQAHTQLQSGLRASGLRLLFLAGELGEAQAQDFTRRIGAE